MDEKVIPLRCMTTLDIPVERIITSAEEANLESIVVIGWEDDGSFYFASSISDGADVLWLLEKAKKQLLDVMEVNDE